MSITLELLNALKASQGNVSDYRAAKLLLVSQQTISKYKAGVLPMSPEKVILACKYANLNPSEWLLRLHRERARCSEEQTIYDDLLSRLAA